MHRLLLLIGLTICCSVGIAAASLSAHNASLFWGTYRPGLYFGTRTRSADTLLTGLMWHGVSDLESWKNIRHNCDQGDDMKRYGWLKHDGRSFGTQEVHDTRNNVLIKTEFLKASGGEHGGEWAVRISGSSLTDQDAHIAVYYYASLEGNGRLQFADSESDDQTFIRGETKELGQFALVVVDDERNEPPPSAFPRNANLPDLRQMFTYSAQIPHEQVWRAKDIVQSNIVKTAQDIYQANQNSFTPENLFLLSGERSLDPNFAVIERVLKTPFTLDVVFLSQSAHPHSKLSVDLVRDLSGKALTTALGQASARFDERFEHVFALKDKGFAPDQIDFAKHLLSNMVGGMGYFHGTAIVDRALEGREDEEINDFVEDTADDDDDDYFGGEKIEPIKPNPQLEGPFSLFTAVPSRPFFPRGFLWDEGFHELLIGTWDSDLSLDVIQHWADLIDDKGWVAREQILGDEARSRVPKEFQTQYPHFANPPTLAFSLKKHVERLQHLSSGRAGLDVQAILDAGDDSVHGWYRQTHSKLLDQDGMVDYLVAVYPKFKQQYEWFRRTQWGEGNSFGRSNRGGEAYRWRGRTDQHTLTSGLDDYPRASPPHSGELHVDLISWVGCMAQTLQAVAERLDEYEDADRFRKDVENIQLSIQELHWNPESQSYCDLSVNEQGHSVHLVHKGYLSLMPAILGLVPGDSDTVGAVLDLIEDPNELWTPFGIASLSKSDPFFGTSENYWRGPIWININYLTLGWLHSLKESSGPYKARAETIYHHLRKNVVVNVYKKYEEQGFVWEQYSPLDGQGKRSHPFTGWTALVALIMAEIY
ncbi:glycoside hydrolase [Polychytrium aggregatum]|uniref:glycoside hydrolase n=1 Tax=Polychytrium aggregatum TaxID=110093 RepID=UPI0022FDBEA9|nr:glycoside hydrolase [Polychytrium aggregatum]KAI9202677.1 glycoside hydrolase [Polychytrium aggregatum]